MIPRPYLFERNCDCQLSFWYTVFFEQRFGLGNSWFLVYLRECHCAYVFLDVTEDPNAKWSEPLRSVARLQSTVDTSQVKGFIRIYKDLVTV